MAVPLNMHAQRLWLVVLLVGTPGALASEHEDRVGMLAENEGNTFWFEVNGVEGRNPALALRPGSEVVVEVENVGTTIHNLHFDTGDRSRLLQPGERDTFRVRVAEDADPQSLLYYWCDPHRDLGMIGSVRLASDISEAGALEGENGEASGLGGLLHLSWVGLLAVGWWGRHRRSR